MKLQLLFGLSTLVFGSKVAKTDTKYPPKMVPSKDRRVVPKEDLSKKPDANEKREARGKGKGARKDQKKKMPTPKPESMMSADMGAKPEGMDSH